jgi:hypothetical protein
MVTIPLLGVGLHHLSVASLLIHSIFISRSSTMRNPLVGIILIKGLGGFFLLLQADPDLIIVITIFWPEYRVVAALY